jgi:hypothetical protein
MVQIELPHVNVLSKIDIIEQFGKLGIHTIILLSLKPGFILRVSNVHWFKNIYLDKLSTASLVQINIFN